uniref:Tudor domain-containing protein n=1 Tax=Trichobilharzia regenti TaxID=157069 RepID=A0AA85JAQ8_TRIRE|nr:unnamed protein product [Trichobilharzia regenti]
MQHSITSFLSSDEPLVYAKWRFEENYYAGKIESVENHSCYLITFEDTGRAIVKESDIIQVYLLPVGAIVSAQIKDDNDYWGNCIIQTHLSDPDCPYKILHHTTNEFYRLRRFQVSINETEVKNLRDRKLLQTNHFEPRDSPHCDPEVLRANVSSSSGTGNRKRRPKPKVFGDDWITPDNYRKRSKSESGEVRDNVKSEDANRLHIEIMGCHHRHHWKVVCWIQYVVS